MRPRVVVVAGCAIAAAGALVAARVLSASRAAWEAGEDRIAEYNRLAGSGADDAERRLALLREAIVSYREAASWDLPENPWARRSAARLVTIGQKAELADDEALAFSAYRAARASAMETRTFAAPATEALDRASRGIARLSARALPPG
ncbi:MAG: hypothetical protein QME96_14840, partial [Myxococcota bacterium]|nr:hypothetical protein [Myxococcota bacterium]